MEHQTGIDGLRIVGVVLLTTLLGTGLAKGQANLVPNPSFEQYNFCSSNAQGLGWPHNWLIPEQGADPDYYNACSELMGLLVPSNWVGYQNAHTGDAYVGLYAFWTNSPYARDLLYAQLNDTLSEGSRYIFSMYLSLGDDALYSVRKMGMLLTDTVPSSHEPLIDITPTYFNNLPVLDNKTDWVLLSDTITANGGEKYMTLGCFFSDSLCDTVFVGQGNPNFQLAYYYIDDVSLIPLDSLLAVENQKAIEVDLYPNPASDHITLKSKKALKTAWLSDISGRRLWQMERRTNIYWETDLGGLPNGVYLIEAITEDGRKAVRKVVKL